MKKFIANQVYCKSVLVERINGTKTIKRVPLICSYINGDEQSAIFHDQEGRQFTVSLNEFNSHYSYNGREIPHFYIRNGAYLQLHKVRDEFLLNINTTNKEQEMAKEYFDDEELNESYGDDDYYDDEDDFDEDDLYDEDDYEDDDDDFDDYDDEDDYEDDDEYYDEDDDDYDDDFDDNDDFEDDDDYDDYEDEDY